MRETHERPVCHRAEDLVSYLYGEASPGDALDFRDHLQRCDACRSEFASFNQVHSSIQGWRNESLGVAFNPAAAALPASEVRHERKLSALAALREFFNVSPLWLRGATAFAALLLCLLGVMMVARLSRKPVETVQVDNQPKYSEEQLRTAVNKAVDKKVLELKAESRNSSSAPEPKPRSTTSPKRVQLAANRQPKNLQHGLNRQEREQLAADLRLILPPDEEELPLVLPERENPNY